MNPDIQKRLQDEIDRSLEENEGKFTYEAVNNMKYLDMVVSGKYIITCLCQFHGQNYVLIVLNF